MNDEAGRIRPGHGVENAAIIRHMMPNLLNQDSATKLSKKRQGRPAACSAAKVAKIPGPYGLSAQSGQGERSGNRAIAVEA